MINFGGSWSGPVSFLAFSDFIILVISPSVVCLNVRDELNCFHSFYAGVINKAILLDSFVSYMNSHIDVIDIHNFGNLPMICYNSPVLKES